MACVFSGLFLLVGTVAALTVAPGTARADLGESFINICKNGNVTGTFQFSLNSGTPISIQAGTCDLLPVENGYNFVTELADSTGATQLSAITVSPSVDTVSLSVPNRTVTVNIPADKTTQTTFTNVERPQVEVCKIAGDPSLLNQPFNFSYNGGTAFTLNAGNPPGTCSTPQSFASNAAVTVAEQVPTGDMVASITSSGSGSCTTSLSAATATCTLGATGLTTVTYTDTNEPQIEVCKIAGDPALLNQPFSFTYNGGTAFTVKAGNPPGDCSTPAIFSPDSVVTVAEQVPSGDTVTSITSSGSGSCTTSLSAATATCTLSAPGLTTVTYTDASMPPEIQVCKIAGDPSLLKQPFSFSYNGGAPFTVKAGKPPGKCSTPAVFAPNAAVTVAEDVPAGDTVSSITSSGSGSCTTSLSAATATCTLGATGLTTVTYTDTNEPEIQVCKIAGDPSLLKQPFSFSYNGGTPFTVKAGKPPGKCSTPAVFAPNAAVTVAEDVPAGDTVSSITSSGSGSCTTSLSAATATCTLGATGLTTVTYTDAPSPSGYVEVCKVAGDPSVDGHSFAFSVNGGAAFDLVAGTCSAPIQVPPGTATVQESQSDPDFYLSSVSTVSVTDPTGSRLLSGPTGNPATVQVPGGGVANETVVTFTNDTVQSVFRICTAQTSPGANLAGVPMPYSYSYTVNGITTTGSVSLVTPLSGTTCSLTIGPFNAVNSDGTPATISVTAGTPPVSAVDLAQFAYQGTGVVTSEPTLPATFPATVTVDGGVGDNVLTFTDGASH